MANWNLVENAKKLKSLRNKPALKLLILVVPAIVLLVNALLKEAAAPCSPEDFRLIDISQATVQWKDFAVGLNVLFLVSPGYHCPACLGTVAIWDDSIKTWSSAEIRSFVVGDGTHVTLKEMEVYQNVHALNSRILFDPKGHVRSCYRLPDGPVILGLSKKGLVTFQLPLLNSTAKLDKEVAFPQFFISSLIGELRFSPNAYP